MRVFGQRGFSRSAVRRRHPAITDDVCVDDNHGRPARFQPLISASLIWRVNFARGGTCLTTDHSSYIGSRGGSAGRAS